MAYGSRCFRRCVVVDAWHCDEEVKARVEEAERVAVRRQCLISSVIIMVLPFGAFKHWNRGIRGGMMGCVFHLQCLFCSPRWMDALPRLQCQGSADLLYVGVSKSSRRHLRNSNRTAKLQAIPPTSSNFTSSTHSLTPTPPRRWHPPTSPRHSMPPPKTSRCSSPPSAISAARTCRCTWSHICGRPGPTGSM